MAERSREIIEVGYYLSKYGQSLPPSKLGTKKWNEAYRMFYDALNNGREVLEFEHSLKNSRDAFDAHFPFTKREGWKAEDGTPKNLTSKSAAVFKNFSQMDENSIWGKVSMYWNPNTSVNPLIFKDLIAEDTANSDNEATKTEGGVKVVTYKTLERKASLRQEALNIHGYTCQVCGFNFEKAYGQWGALYAEVHHIVPLHESKGQSKKTNPRKDLAVLCANCHRMVHRKKNVTLTIKELKAKLS
jgi:5-methylcytosine-specific restriction protein A